MANFCQNCGAALTEGAKFCPACGTPSMQAAPQPQQPPAQPPQKQYTPRPQVHIPEQFAQTYAAKAQAKAQSGAPAPRKKGKGGLVALIVILLVAVIGVVCFLGFRDGGWFRGGKTYDAQSMQSLLNYARQLEKAGNGEAAEAVYELIAKGGGAELIQKAHEDIPIVEATDEIEQITEIFGGVKGGGGK